MVAAPTDRLLDVLVERVEEVAAKLEHGRCSPNTAALLLRQRVAEVRQALGTTRAPEPAERLG